jgi:hypothetical protein
VLLPEADSKTLTFLPGERKRRFLVPPKGCTFIDAVIIDKRVKPEVGVRVRVRVRDRVRVRFRV